MDGGGEGGVPNFGVTVDPNDDPTTCAEAAAWKSYVGCDYWPTVVANNVWSIFDYAVVVANAGTAPAMVTITGPMGTSQSQTVAPDDLAKFYLPWVPELKGGDSDSCGNASPLATSVVMQGAAFHLVSSVPVTVYQFNALEYAGKGGPGGKDWSKCPGDQMCSSGPNKGSTLGCFSFTNDSSLLLPSTALTGSYRITGYPGETANGTGYMAGYVAITATMDGTHARVLLTSAADILPGSGVQATAASGELDLILDAGDVAELVTDVGEAFDLSGSLVLAETLGKQYFVNVPSGPGGYPVGHVVRMYGNVNGTKLTYAPYAPTGCPATLDAGQVVDCGVVELDFEVTGSNEFAVGTFMLGGSVVDPMGGLGDPSQSMVASVEQYRTKYVFLAPSDYEENYVVIIAPSGAAVSIDGAATTATATPLGSTGYEVIRQLLGSGQQGAHELDSAQAVGIQVMGYGAYTSYTYPGGLNLHQISPPPPAQ